MSDIQKDVIFDVQRLPQTKIINHIIPSAVILNYSSNDEGEPLGKVVSNWLSNGAVHIASVGENAASTEDAVDWIIVDDDKSDVVTTAHVNESANEALDFVMLHMGLNFDTFRVVFVTNMDDEITKEWVGLIAAEKAKKGQIS